MREIKFRGKRIDNGEWIEGLLLTNKLGTYIITEKNPHECTQYGYLEIEEYGKVDPDSVGQLTPLQDKNGKEIYEGDRFRSLLSAGKSVGTIQYVEDGFKIVWDEPNYGCLNNILRNHVDRGEVIGDIYSSPHLLEQPI